ncbi:uncharacterized protein LOC114768547 [Denticeps clupeoides]|uniref:uncharacterized protein LOC114768547 n=1 Tax=Denticeps clupeoides TaxID=299321 RepID=UPI0010A596A2|nr:BTB/POZ domain-containing protein 18 [Denticeps clupeoides]
MGRFALFLLKELQRQQLSAQFCDTILQAQGVSVPVHSCVLSAFSPRLSGTLSALPAVPAGHCRLIQLEAVKAATLLRLVGLLYSGVLEGDKEELLLAAGRLGIKPWLEGKERRPEDEGAEEDGWHHGGGKRCIERVVYREVAAQTEGLQWIRESSMQTFAEQHTGEGEHPVHHDITSSQLPQRVTEEWPSDWTRVCPTVPYGTDGTRPWETQCCLPNRASVPGSPPNDVTVPGVMTSTLDDAALNALIYGTGMVQNVQHPSVPNFSAPTQPLLSPSNTLPRDGEDIRRSMDEDEYGELLESFEGDIPEFINYFLGGPQSERSRPRSRGQRGRGMPSAERGARVRTSRGARQGPSTSSRVGGRRRGRGGVALREGRPVRLGWTGCGGGRVGSQICLRPKMACVRQRRCRAQGGQGGTPGTCRPRGCPRLRPIPVPQGALQELPEPSDVSLGQIHGDILDFVLQSFEEQSAGPSHNNASSANTDLQTCTITSHDSIHRSSQAFPNQQNLQDGLIPESCMPGNEVQNKDHTTENSPNPKRKGKPQLTLKKDDFQVRMMTRSQGKQCLKSQQNEKDSQIEQSVRKEVTRQRPGRPVKGFKSRRDTGKYGNLRAEVPQESPSVPHKRKQQSDFKKGTGHGVRSTRKRMRKDLHDQQSKVINSVDRETATSAFKKIRQLLEGRRKQRKSMEEGRAEVLEKEITGEATTGELYRPGVEELPPKTHLPSENALETYYTMLFSTTEPLLSSTKTCSDPDQPSRSSEIASEKESSSMEIAIAVARNPESKVKKESPGSTDDDVDVIGFSSPVPEPVCMFPVVIEVDSCSEEDSDIDVID